MEHRRITTRNVTIRISCKELERVMSIVERHKEQCLSGVIPLSEWNKEGIILTGKQVVFDKI